MYRAAAQNRFSKCLEIPSTVPVVLLNRTTGAPAVPPCRADRPQHRVGVLSACATPPPHTGMIDAAGVARQGIADVSKRKAVRCENTTSNQDWVTATWPEADCTGPCLFHPAGRVATLADSAERNRPVDEAAVVHWVIYTV